MDTDFKDIAKFDLILFLSVFICVHLWLKIPENL